MTETSTTRRHAAWTLSGALGCLPNPVISQQDFASLLATNRARLTDPQGRNARFDRDEGASLNLDVDPPELVGSGL